MPRELAIPTQILPIPTGVALPGVSGKWLPAKRRPRLRLGIILALILASAALTFFTWQHLYPVSAPSGWSYQVYRNGIEAVSALALDEKGNLFVSRELRHGKGSILQIQPDGTTLEVLGGLSKPDGLLIFRGGLVIPQEGGEAPLQWLRDGKRENLLTGVNIEEVATDGRYLYAIEDRQSGRLLRYEPETATTTVLRDGLNEAEAITACPDGRLLYAEKQKGWIKQWQPDGNDTLIYRGLNQPGFLACDASGLWITEDATHLARLLRLDNQGNLQVILDHLRSAQTVLPLPNGHLLLSEQGRGRILELTNQPDGFK
jgi:hypothetical protein